MDEVMIMAADGWELIQTKDLKRKLKTTTKKKKKKKKGFRVEITNS